MMRSPKAVRVKWRYDTAVRMGMVWVSALCLAACAGRGGGEPVSSPPTRVAAAAGSSAQPPPGMRLPRGVTPIRQRLELTIDPRDERYRGRAEIDVALAQPTD